MKRQRLSARKRVVVSLFGLTVVSGAFLSAYMVRTRSLDFVYLVWNLFLAWLPLLLSGLLLRLLKTRLWSDWLPVLVSLVWLVMLPNSFYMISDFIHVQEMAAKDVLFGVVMFSSFIFTAALLGFISLYSVQAELRQRVGHRVSVLLAACILLACSFAIYLGRDLRWNSWDVLLNPAGILFDVSDRLLHPLGHPGAFSVTLSFFVLLGSLYAVGWQIGEATRQKPAP